MPAASLKTKGLVIGASLLLGLIVALLTSWLLVRANRRSQATTVRVSFESHDDGYYDVIRPLPPVPFEADVTFPKYIKTSETQLVVAKLVPNDKVRLLSVQGDATLESPSFGVKPAGKERAVGQGSFEWEWALHPQALGTHSVIVSFFPLAVSVPQVKMQPVVLIQPPHPISAEITVSDSLGLSAGQTQVLGALGVGTTILSTIVGLQFWPLISALWKKKDDRPKGFAQ